MSQIDEILSAIPIDRLAAQLGVDPDTAEDAVRKAVPSLLGGMEANAQDPAGAASLSRAVGGHSSALVDGGVNLDDVDTDDGDRIVSNVFGPERNQVVNQLAGSTKADSGLIGKLLPLLAPIVMSYLAKQMSGRSAAPGGGGGGIADILGGVLGGGGGGGKAGGFDIGSVLGGLLGGGKR
jgi:hypothetical protein